MFAESLRQFDGLVKPNRRVCVDLWLATLAKIPPCEANGIRNCSDPIVRHVFRGYFALPWVRYSTTCLREFALSVVREIAAMVGSDAPMNGGSIPVRQPQKVSSAYELGWITFVHGRSIPLRTDMNGYIFHSLVQTCSRA